MALSAGLLLAGCSGSEGEPEETSSPSAAANPTTTPSESPSESKTAAGEGITSPGSQLGYGDTATVKYESKGRSAVLDLTVRSAQRGAITDFSGFDTQDPLVKNANFYYVRVQVKNAGKTPFGNAAVPLRGISGENKLLPPVKFTSSFEKCPTETLPAKFGKGATFSTCLVFLSPTKGTLEGVSYRPTVGFVPIEWRGKVDKAGGADTGGGPGDKKAGDKGGKKATKSGNG